MCFGQIELYNPSSPLTLLTWALLYSAGFMRVSITSLAASYFFFVPVGAELGQNVRLLTKKKLEAFHQGELLKLKKPTTGGAGETKVYFYRLHLRFLNYT